MRPQRLADMRQLSYNDLSAERQVVAAVQALEAILQRHRCGEPDCVARINDPDGGLVLYRPGKPDPEILYAPACDLRRDGSELTELQGKHGATMAQQTHKSDMIPPAISHDGESQSNEVRRRIRRTEPKGLRTFTPSLAVIAKSAGCYHWTPEGRQLADFTSGVLVANLGHNPVRWWQRVWQYLQLPRSGRPAGRLRPHAAADVLQRDHAAGGSVL